jgi:hypothetical protein
MLVELVDEAAGGVAVAPEVNAGATEEDAEHRVGSR